MFMEQKINQEKDLEAIKDKLRSMGINLEGRAIEIITRPEIGEGGVTINVEYVHVEKVDETQGPVFSLKSLGL